MATLEDVHELTNSIKIPRIIKAIKKHSIIWNKSTPHLRNKVKVERAWYLICANLIPGWDDLPKYMKSYCVAVLKKKWKNVRDYYMRQLHQREIGKRGQYVYFDLLSFLKPFYTNVGEYDNNPQHQSIEEDDDDDGGDMSNVDLSAYDDEYWAKETPTPTEAPSPSELPIEVFVKKSLDLSLLIKEIKKYPIIWNSVTSYLTKGNKSMAVVWNERGEAWNSICNELIPKWEDSPKEDKRTCIHLIKKKWAHLRDYYRQNIMTSGPEYIYSELLSFMKPLYIDNKKQVGEDDGEVSYDDLSAYGDEYWNVSHKEVSVTETPTPAATPSTSQLPIDKFVKSLKLPPLVQEVKKYPVIWHKFMPAGRSKASMGNKRTEAWNSICKELIPKWEDVSNNDKQKYIQQLKKRWGNVRDYYRRNIIDNGPEYIYEHSLLLSFLKPLYTAEPDKTTNCELTDKDMAYEAEYLNEIGNILSVSKMEPEEPIEDPIEDPIETPSTSGVAEFVPKKFCVKMFEKNTLLQDYSSKIPSTSGIAKPVPKQFRAEMSEKDASPSKSQTEEIDLKFFRSLLPDIKMLDDDQKFEFKLATMKLLKKIKNNQVFNYSDSE